MSARTISNCIKVSTILFLLLFFQFSFAQDFSAAGAKLDAAKKELGGKAVMAVYKDGKIVYQKSLSENKSVLDEFNLKTQVPIASCSKWLTAALVMSFVDQGKISLDDKVSQYIPIFKTYSKGYITIRDCLSHLTGIEAEPLKGSNFFSRKKYESLEEEIKEFASKKEIESNPSLLFRYSNVGLNIAAHIAEIVGKRGFDQLMQERITRPLMMRNTSFSSFSAINPSGGALSTASDYLNFLAMLLNNGTFNGKQVLTEKSVNEMLMVRTTPSMIRYAPKQAEGFNYGFGAWVLQADENARGTVLADFGLLGTFVMLDRCRGYAMVVFTKGEMKDEDRNLYMDIKSAVDEVLPANKCK